MGGDSGDVNICMGRIMSYDNNKNGNICKICNNFLRKYLLSDNKKEKVTNIKYVNIYYCQVVILKSIQSVTKKKNYCYNLSFSKMVTKLFL